MIKQTYSSAPNCIQDCVPFPRNPAPTVCSYLDVVYRSLPTPHIPVSQGGLIKIKALGKESVQSVPSKNILHRTVREWPYTRNGLNAEGTKSKGCTVSFIQHKG